MLQSPCPLRFCRGRGRALHVPQFVIAVYPGQLGLTLAIHSKGGGTKEEPKQRGPAMRPFDEDLFSMVVSSSVARGLQLP